MRYADGDRMTARPRLSRPAGLSSARAERLDAFAFRRGSTLPLFEALAHSQIALEDLAAGTHAAIETTMLPVRLREILILRTLAQWGARAEWDVHVLLYAPAAPLTQVEIERLGGSRRMLGWSAGERLMINLADSLRQGAGIPENLWQALAHAFDAPMLAEILMIATQYVKVALMTNALAIPALVPDGPAIALSKGTAHG